MGRHAGLLPLSSLWSTNVLAKEVKMGPVQLPTEVWEGNQLKASASPLSAPFWYSKVNSKEGGQHAYPSVPSGIEVWGGEDVHQWIVVSPNHKWCIHEVLLEVFSDTPLESKELKFRAVIVFI